MGTLLMYAIMILFLMFSKLVLIGIHARRNINLWGLIAFSLTEVLILTLFYVAITMLVKQNGVSPMQIFPKAFMCILLILVIPYIIAYQFGYTKALRLQSGKLPDNKLAGTRIVSIHDNKGNIKLSLRIMDILYAVSEDNYVKVFYESDGTVHNTMIRATAKTIEEDLEGSITRCHRSYMVNIARVRFFNNDRDNLYIILDQDGINPIPVSRSYRDTISSLLSK